MAFRKSNSTSAASTDELPSTVSAKSTLSAPNEITEKQAKQLAAMEAAMRTRKAKMKSEATEDSAEKEVTLEAVMNELESMSRMVVSAACKMLELKSENVTSRILAESTRRERKGKDEKPEAMVATLT